MDYRQLGRSGLRVSKVCLGTMVGFTKKEQVSATRVVQEAIDLGINFIDTADCYGESEEVVGQALSDGGRREQVVLSTKVGWHMGKGPNDCGQSRAHIIEGCEASLRRLGTDYIDLYVLHVVDINTPFDETLRALDLLVQQGKVRYIGTSKHPAALIVEALGVSNRLGVERFVSEQPPYNLLDRSAENGLLWAARRHGIGITPFAPLARGLLSGKYGPGGEAPEGSRISAKQLGANGSYPQAAIDAVEKLRPLAVAKGIGLAEFSLAWLMHQPAVVAPVVGARTVEYVRSAVRACDVTFTHEDLAKIDEIVPPGSCLCNFYPRNVYGPLRVDYAAGIAGAAYIPNNRPA